jgi:hypothetical protein
MKSHYLSKSNYWLLLLTNVKLLQKHFIIKWVYCFTTPFNVHTLTIHTLTQTQTQTQTQTHSRINDSTTTGNRVSNFATEYNWRSHFHQQCIGSTRSSTRFSQIRSTSTQSRHQIVVVRKSSTMDRYELSSHLVWLVIHHITTHIHPFIHTHVIHFRFVISQTIRDQTSMIMKLELF